MSSGALLAALGSRVHLFLQPSARDAFIRLFRDVMGCNVLERDFGMAYPILLVSFADGSAFSAEFSEPAPADPLGDALDDGRALRGAWIEFRTADLEAAQQKLREAGVREFCHPGSPHVYFSAPGGQVFRLLDLSYVGP